MKYISTRNNHEPVSAADAIRLGMVPGGGLFVPESVPEFDFIDFKGRTYKQLAAAILPLYLTDFSREELESYVTQAYGTERFDHPDTAPLTHLDDATSVLELWHGPTAAFKDMALQLMPHLLTAGVHKGGLAKETVILVATSGDTGKAALEGFRDVPGTRIIVFYPEGGVSRVQELQMRTTGGSNTAVVAVEGNFDDCQTMVKEIFGDREYAAALDRDGFAFSSANSINWGRLVPQIIYYYWAYLVMIRDGRIGAGNPVNFAVPTGNFGNILAAWYAREMGLPIKTLICASNRNRVLTDFFTTGEYNRQREFHKTSSPSMDILISSNLERFLFHLADSDRVRDWYAALGKDGVFRIGPDVLEEMSAVIHPGTCDEKETEAEIGRVWREHGYLMDTHTAVGSRVIADYRKATGDTTPVILDSTASPYKFGTTVYRAAFGEPESADELAVLEQLSRKSGTPMHRTIAGLEDLPVMHNSRITLPQARETIRRILAGD